MIKVGHKKAFSMLTAIVVIVMMSALTMYVTGLSGKGVKITTDQYRKEQAILYAKSYTEYAIMAVSADLQRLNGNNCLQTITANIANQTTLTANRGRGDGYRIRVQISYIGNNSTRIDTADGTCPTLRELSDTVNQGLPITQNLTPLTLLIDTYVDYNDLNDNRPDDALSNAPDNGELRHFTYHRRSLQKI